jgi:hypothetical protein
MASGNKEHKMLFDVRGRRRTVVKVVYAVLALLMGLSLFLLAGSGGIGSIFGNGTASNDEAISQLENQAKRIEVKIAKEPENDALLLTLVRNQISTANLMSDVGPRGEPLVTIESRQQLNRANSTWNEYLEATDEPATAGAQLMATTLFGLAQASRTNVEAEENVKSAAKAQQIVAEQSPSLGSLSTAALYTLYTFDYKEAEKLLKEAKSFASSPTEREQLDRQFEETKKGAEEFESAYKENVRATKAAEGSRPPQEQLRNPLNLGGGTGLSE